MTRNSQSIENRTVPVKLSTAFLIILSTITTEASMMAVYYNIKDDIKEVKTQQNTQSQIYNMRFGTLEGAQRENHEWLRTLANRISALERQQTSFHIIDKTDKEHK
jgi:hypothetical protein